MTENIVLKILLAPFSLLYGMGVSIHQFLYQKGWLKSVKFDIPIISIGNLSVGGSGKTPHTEYLIRLLKDYLEVGTLSRGYRRSSKGYLQIQRHMNAAQAGDEPLQFKRKFPEVFVSVAENRVLGIPQMLQDAPGLQTILLDDAFQHRAVKPGLNVLLTNYNRLFTRDFLLPMGRLREWRSSYERADIIVVTKCPDEMSRTEAEAIVEEIQPLEYQKVFFSYYEYQKPYFLLNPQYKLDLNEETDILLICAIANTDYLVQYLNEQAGYVGLKAYEDHHYFSETELSNLKRSFEEFESNKKVIITTEKDAMRLEMHKSYLIQHRLPIFVLPISVKFHFEEGRAFDDIIKTFLLNFKV